MLGGGRIYGYEVIERTSLVYILHVSHFAYNKHYDISNNMQRDFRIYNDNLCIGDFKVIFFGLITRNA